MCGRVTVKTYTERNAKPFPSFVCLFVCGVALRASTKLWRRGVRGGVYIFMFGGLFDLLLFLGNFSTSRGKGPKDLSDFYAHSCTFHSHI